MTQANSGTIRIGGAGGFWGDSPIAAAQLIAAGVDVLILDYLAEITMSIMARARAQDPNAGFATDFIDAVLKPNLDEIATRGVKVIANAGGVNPKACAVAAQALIAERGLNLKVAVVTGDDLLARVADIAAAAPQEMFTGAGFPPTDKIASINAYLGAFPIAKALAAGADIVITGRAVDSALTLGACIHAFGWKDDDWDLLAAGSLAGHIIECGPQATGGNFTDWEDAGDIARIGYPIAEIGADGAFEITKPGGTAGVVSVGSVAEQLLYEIADPQAYILPDVVCDFSDVVIEPVGENRVRVAGARGRPAPDAYKVSLTWQDGFRGGLLLTMYGFDADRKARALADAMFERARMALRRFNAGDFTETSVEILGSESQFGDFASLDSAREVVLKIAARHPDARAIGILLKEAVGLGLATPPGLCGFSGGRPKPSPVVRLFSFLTPKGGVEIAIDIDGKTEMMKDMPGAPPDTANISRPAPPLPPTRETPVSVPLIRLAWARSGDKGDKANIGVIARRPDYLPYIWAALDENAVARRFSHAFAGGADAAKVERYYLPGTNSINFLLDAALGGGGVASLRNDPQGKGFGQVLLAAQIPVPADIAESLQ